MSPVEVMRVAWLGILRRPLRSSLTAASLLIGVVTLVLVEATGTLIQAATVQRAILSSGPSTTLLVTLNAGNESLGDGQDRWRRQLERITHDVGGRVADYNNYSSATVLSGEEFGRSFELVGVSSNIRAIRPFRLLHGSWFASQTLVPQLVMNEGAWGELSSPRTPMSISTRDGFDRLRVKVVGVVDDGATEPTAYVSTLQTDALAAAGLDPTDQSLLLSSTITDQATLTSRVETLAKVTGRTEAVGEIIRIDQIDEYDEQLATTRRVFFAIAALCLLVGGVGILNIGLASLRDRSEELSLRRALGATRSKIMCIMMLESQIVALSSAAGAIMLAYLVVPAALKAITSVPVESTALPVRAAILGVAASSLAAMLGALAPSIRASRIPIASILRS